MPNTLFSFATDDHQVRYKEPTFTASVNKRFIANQPKGVYRGFRLSTNVLALRVTVSPDGTTGDHAAVYATDTFFTQGIRRSGSINLDLTAYAGSTVVIALYAVYAVGPTTTAVIRAYTLAEFTAPPVEINELVVLGTVVVPGSGVIPAANISHDRRIFAWQNTAPEATLWSPLIRNPSFEATVNAASHKWVARYWETSDLASPTTFVYLKTAPVRSGAFAVRSTGTSLTGKLFQRLNVAVQPGTLVKVQIYVSTSAVKTGGAASLYVEWASDSGSTLSTTLIDISTSADAGAFRLIQQVLTAPTNAAFVRTVGVFLNALTFAGSSTVTFDDAQCWVERKGPQDALQDQERFRTHVNAYPLVLEDPAAAYSGKGSSVYFDPSTPSEGRVKATFFDESLLGSDVPPAWAFFGSIFSGEGLLNTADFAKLPRRRHKYVDNVTTAYTNIDDIEPHDGTGAHVRTYFRKIGSTLTWVLTYNAKWRPAGADKWGSDDNTENSAMFEWSTGSGLTVYTRQSGGTDPWVDTLATPPSTDGWTEASSYSSAEAILRGVLHLRDAAGVGYQDTLGRMIGVLADRERTQIFGTAEFEGSSNVPAQRIYIQASGGGAVSFEITGNAWWDDTGPNWAPDAEGDPAWTLRLEDGRLRLMYEAGPSAGGFSEFTETGLDLHFETDGLARIGGRLQLGDSLLGTEANAILPRTRVLASTGASIERTNVFDNDSGAAVRRHRVYLTGAAGANNGTEIEYAINAKWGGTTWSADDTGFSSKLYRFQNGTLVVFQRAAGAGTWTHTVGGGGWDAQPAILDFDAHDYNYTDPVFFMTSVGANSNPANTAGMSNVMLAKNTLKAWALVEIDATSGSAVATIKNGFNMIMDTPNFTTNRVNMKLPAGLADTDFIVKIDQTNRTGAPSAAAARVQFIDGNRSNSGGATFFGFTGFDEAAAAEVALGTAVSGIRYVQISVWGQQSS